MCVRGDKHECNAIREGMQAMNVNTGHMTDGTRQMCVRGDKHERNAIRVNMPTAVCFHVLLVLIFSNWRAHRCQRSHHPTEGCVMQARLPWREPSTASRASSSRPMHFARVSASEPFSPRRCPPACHHRPACPGRPRSLQRGSSGRTPGNETRTREQRSA